MFTDGNGRWAIFLTVIFLAGLGPRLWMAVEIPHVTPDGETYGIVADNIRLNGCVSVSDPKTGECAPHWGGNQSPFYPALIAAGRSIFPDGPRSILVFQSVLFLLAVLRLVYAVAEYARDRTPAIAVGLLLALSPGQMAWSRFVLTETLATAAAIWVLAECILSIREGRLRMWMISLGLILAVGARYDSVLLAFPVAYCGFVCHRPVAAISKGLVMALIIAIPIGAWTARNVSVGLSAVPNTLMKSGEPTPWGLLKWSDTWVTTLYEGTFSYDIANNRFHAVNIDLSRFSDPFDRQRVEALIAELRLHDGQPFPERVDRGFGELAAWRRTNYPLTTWVVVPLTRAANIWLNPLHSFGWPTGLGRQFPASDRANFAGGLASRLDVVLRYPVQAAGKGVITAYRYLVLAAFVLIAVLAFRSVLPRSRHIVVLVGLHAIIRTLVMAQQSSMDSRYVVPALAGLELAVAFGIGELISRRRARGQRSGPGSVGVAAL